MARPWQMPYGDVSLAARTSAAGETLVAPRNGESITRINATTNPIAPMWKAVSVIPKASSRWRPLLLLAASLLGARSPAFAEV